MYNPITHIKNHIEKRKRIRKAVKLLVLAGTVRSIDVEIVHRTADGKTRRIFVK